jgi:phosphoglucomutase/phosphomannomutase
LSYDLRRATLEMSRLATRPEHAEAAMASLSQWLHEDRFAAYRPLLVALLDAGAWDTLLDSFYRILPFGTGGRRGPVGVGPNRMNPWALGTSVQGNVDFLRQRFGADADLSVVIAADVRIFKDLRGSFPPVVDNPLIDMTSEDLSRQAAAIYAANGVEVHMLEPGSGRFLATPELSFLIRWLGTQGGLNVSASHNHPDDTGGKFYTEQGAQEVPPDDEKMIDLVNRVESVQSMSWDDAVASGRIHFLGPQSHEAYLDEVATVLRGDERDAKVVFTNLHGVGDTNAGESLERAGFDVHYVPSQRSHDGLFPNVRFRAPNPEYPSAFTEAVELAVQLDADLVLATDPDADRIGAMVPDPEQGPGQWRFLTGNELAALVAAARFDGAPPGKIGIKTEVTSSLFSRVVLAAGGQVVDHLLVGCKYIAGVMRELETTGRSGSVTGGIEDVLIGAEESHGFLISPNMRDKDGATPALILAEFASREKRRGRSLLAALEDLFREHGAVANIQVPLVMAGAVGRGRIESIQREIRSHPPATIAGRKVTAFFDRQDEDGVFGPIVSGTDRSARDVLAFSLGPDHRLVIRPSGTEPKTKIYAEAIVPVTDDLQASLAEARRQAQELADDFVCQALAVVGLELPPAGLHCSALLGVEERSRFAAQVLPAAVEQARSGASEPQLRSWVEAQIGAWGGDGIGMTAGGYSWWRGAEASHSGLDAEQLGRLDRVWASP